MEPSTIKPIVTLTLNPAIDVACEADKVEHTAKIRTFNELIQPGGGGINVARALCGFAAPAHAIYVAGGAPGRVLDTMVEERGIARTAFWIDGDTRISLNVRERQNNVEYRFVPEGAEVPEQAWSAVLDAIATIDCDYLVASGSLPPGVPDDFYVRVARLSLDRGMRFVLDTSGGELRAALGAGIYLVKPSATEFEEAVGERLETKEQIAAAAARMVADGKASVVAVTLADQGAVMACDEGAFHLPSVDVEVCSAVGAGDSFLAGMTFGLAAGNDVRTAFRMGVAAGAAAVSSPGTDLCKTADVDRLLELVGEPRRIAG